MLTRRLPHTPAAHAGAGGSRWQHLEASGAGLVQGRSQEVAVPGRSQRPSVECERFTSLLGGRPQVSRSLGPYPQV